MVSSKPRATLWFCCCSRWLPLLMVAAGQSFLACDASLTVLVSVDDAKMDAEFLCRKVGSRWWFEIHSIRNRFRGDLCPRSSLFVRSVIWCQKLPMSRLSTSHCLSFVVNDAALFWSSWFNGMRNAMGGECGIVHPSSLLRYICKAGRRDANRSCNNTVANDNLYCRTSVVDLKYYVRTVHTRKVVAESGFAKAPPSFSLTLFTIVAA